MSIEHELPLRPDWKKVRSFIFLTFGISWIAALIAIIFGSKYGSPLSLFMVMFLFMPAPAYATIILQKLVYKRHLGEYGLKLRGMKFRSLLISIVACILFVPTTLLVIAVFGNVMGIDSFGWVFFDSGLIAELLGDLTMQEPNYDSAIPFSPQAMLWIGIAGGLVAGLTINLPFTIGEELGWRGMLLKETQPLGFWKGNVFIGTVWGIWHAPLILQGHNYGTEHWGYPVMGILMMTLFCISASFLFGWARLRAKTVLAPAILHGILNGSAGISILYIYNYNILVGSIAGLAGCIALLSIAFIIFAIDRRYRHHYSGL